MLRKFSTLLLIALLLCLSSCGGGSSGTGTRTIEGTIKDQEGTAVRGAEVTLIESGDSTTTNNEGEFSLEVDPTLEQVELGIRSDAIDTTVTVENIDSNSLSVQVDIQVDRDTNGAVLENVEMLAKIVGLCDSYFENNRIIRQANKAPSGVECTAKVWLRAKGRPASSVPFAVQYRGCNRGDELTTVAIGETLFAPEAGAGQVQFKFYDDAAHCVYRIIAPYGISAQKPIVFEVHTFTKQSAGKESVE